MTGGLGALVDRIGVRLEPPTAGRARLALSPSLMRNEQVLVSPLMLAADVASGVRLHLPGVDSVLTSSFSFRRSDHRAKTAISAVSTRLFEQGRRFVDEVEFVADDGDNIGFGRISFVVSGSGDGSATDLRDAALARFMESSGDPIDRPLIEAAEIEVLDPSAGRVRLRSRPGVGRLDSRSGTAIVQGAFVTLVGEAAALALAEHERGGPMVVRSLDADYLAGVTTRTVVTAARWLGRPGCADIGVVLRDDESKNVCATFVIGVSSS